MPPTSSEKKKAYDRERYKKNPGYFARKAKQWRKDRPRRNAYIQQRGKAKSRGVAWEITFEQWVEWWGDDINLRGRQHSNLQMCRYADAGPYKIGNIYKATREENDAGPRPIPECTF